MPLYKKAGDGVYERTAGSGGPETIVRKKGPQQTDLNRPIRTVSDPSD